MFIFDNKTDILIDFHELTFKSEYHRGLFQFCNMREFIEGNALQLSAGHFEGYLSKLITDQVMLELSQQNCLNKQEGIIDRKTWLFAIPVQSKPIFVQNLYQVENNYIGIIPPNREYSIVQHPFSHRFQLYVREDYLNELCKTLDLPSPSKFLNYSQCSVVLCSPAKIHHLQQSCHKLYQILFNLDNLAISHGSKLLRLKFIKQELQQELVKNFILTLTEAKNIRLKKPLIKRSSILKQAEEMMINNVKSDLTIPEICQALGVSQRTLQYVFQDFYQMSPKNYFKRLRLNTLHKFLQQKSIPTFIHEFAEELGFFHRGQLAHDYYQLFGELPSQTIT